ncbi:11063_t:CDS:2, partial [Scutellospora calospora]
TTLNVSGTTKGKEASPVKTLESQLYKGAVECPICFLPICTECFVQIKRPENGSLGANNSPAVCPYCVEPNFGVYYKPPTFNGIENMPVMIPNPNIPPSTSPTSSTSSLNNVSDGKARRRSISHKDSEVVTTDQIRPDWAARVLQQPLRQPPGARRPSPAAPSGSSRRIVVRPGGGNPTFVTSTTPPRRTNPPPTAAAEYGGYLAAMRMGTDLEELMVMEAIRLSLLEQDRERRERERTDSSQDEISNPSSQDEDRERREREERERTGSSQDENSDPRAGTSLPGFLCASLSNQTHVILTDRSDCPQILENIHDGARLNRLLVTSNDTFEGSNVWIRGLTWGEFYLGNKKNEEGNLLQLLHDVEQNDKTLDWIMGSDTFYDPKGIYLLK